MKRVLVSCFLLISALVQGQSSLQAIQQTIDLFDKQDYENTIKVAEKALPAIKLEFGESSPFYSGMILFIGLSHFRLFHYAKAEPYFLLQMQLTSRSAGENSMDYIASLNNIGLLYREMGKFKEAEDSYTKATTITRTLYGVNDTVYAKSINNLGSFYQFVGQYAKAEQLFIQAGNIMKAAVGENTSLYATCLNNLSTLYSDMGQYMKSKPIMLRVVAIRRSVLGIDHTDYAGSLNNMGYTLAALGDYKEAERNFIEAKDVYKRILGENDPDYASTINNLAELYRSMGEYAKAEALYNESMSIRKRTVGEMHPDYALSLNNLASFYEFEGQYELAEKLLKQSGDIVKKEFGEEHPYYITALNNLAGLYHSMGQYVLAEPLYLRSKELRKKIYGETPGYAMSLNNLATIYQEMGLYKKAEPLYLQAKDIWKTSLGEKHPDYAMCLNNLAALYEDMQQYAKAEALYIQSRDIRKSIYGENHIDYATSLNNLAGLYVKMGQYKKAETLMLSAKDIWKKILGEDHPLYATGLNNLGAIYRKMQINYVQAEQYYIQALGLRKKLLGSTHPLTAGTENDLALLYMNKGDVAKAAPLFIKSSQDIMQNLRNTFPVLSEREKGIFINQNLLFDACNNSFLFKYRNAGTELINNNLNLQLFFKSISLSDTRSILTALRNTSDTTLKRFFMYWQNFRVLLAKQYSLPVVQRMKNLTQIEDEAESMEKDLGRRSSLFREQQLSLNIGMKEVQKKLEPNEAAIEFVSFRYFNKKETDSIIYAAYIYKPGDTAAVFVRLFEERQLQKLLDSAGKTATRVAHQFYRGIEVKDRSTVSLENSIYKMVWQPLEDKLKGVKKISYSPAGKLYGVAFHALKVDSTTLLMDKYELQQYVSTRQIAFRTTTTTVAKPKAIVLFGDADFSMDSLQLVNDKGVESSMSGSQIVTRGEGGGAWPGLPGTADEVAAIGKLFDQNKISSKLYLKASATEKNLKSLSGHSPSVLHIATHGFYIPETRSESDNVYKVAQDPLLRNGLVLAGGNYVWSGKEPIEGIEDGIITAYEIAQMDLSQTQLVVLSACETALGDIKGEEGVFGLQRGFKLAGVDKMILSLWQVPDKETAELMNSFYSLWLKGNSIEKAFSLAQSEMRKKYSPFFWAAFVLIQ